MAENKTDLLVNGCTADSAGAENKIDDSNLRKTDDSRPQPSTCNIVEAGRDECGENSESAANSGPVDFEEDHASATAANATRSDEAGAQLEGKDIETGTNWEPSDNATEKKSDEVKDQPEEVELPDTRTNTEPDAASKENFERKTDTGTCTAGQQEYGDETTDKAKANDGQPSPDKLKPEDGKTDDKNDRMGTEHEVPTRTEGYVRRESNEKDEEKAVVAAAAAVAVETTDLVETEPDEPEEEQEVAEEELEEQEEHEVEEEEDEEEVEEEEEGAEEEEDDIEDEDENEQLELGIVGPPTAVSELINEEELRCGGESVLPTKCERGVESVQDHVAEWVQNSAKIDELTIDDDEDENNDNVDEDDEDDEDDDENERREIIQIDQEMEADADDHEKNVEPTATRKSKRVVSNIIKRSIKCLNKMHAVDANGGGKAVVEKNPKKTEKTSERQNAMPEPMQTEERGNAVNAEIATAPRNHRDRRNQQNHSNHRRNGGEPPINREILPRVYKVKKEPASEPTSEPETDLEFERDSVPELRKRATGADGTKNLKIELESKKRRSIDEIQTSNGSSKRACLEQREDFINSLVGGEKVTTEELTARAEQLRAELQALDQLARAKEKEWNEILSMRKLKEEAYLRIERRRQVVGFMEGNGHLNESSGLPAAGLTVEADWENAKEKSNNSTEATLSDKSVTRPQVTSKQSENGQKEPSDGQNSENRQIGEGRQGPMVDVRTIIADYRLRHPETVPRRSRRMRNSVNVGLGAGGAMVETGHVGADSRPSSTDSCKSSSNATDPSNSMSFKDVLVQFAKLSQQQGEAVKTPQNYPDVTLHPVLPTPATPQATVVQQSGSLLHGILTKSQSPRPTTFSPTLARLLTAPERERCNPITTSTPQQTAATQHLLQAYQGTNPVSISDLLSSSKARTEITITPVVSTPLPQSHSNNLIHVEDVEEETTVIEERTRSSNTRDDSPPRCQGCQDRAAQFVCAGCGNQWYCSRECQVSAWDEHSEVCSG